MAPTESATKYHSMRVNLQVIERKTLMGVELNPLDWGWKLSNGYYCPIMTDLNAATGIFFVVFDVITTSPRNAHAVLILAVAKSMVLSVSASRNCNEIDWENCENEVDMDDFSDEKEDKNIFDVFIEKSRTLKNIS